MESNTIMNCERVEAPKIDDRPVRGIILYARGQSAVK